jgi:hypothetical protein
MIIQIALLTTLVLIAVYAFGQRKRSGLVSYAILAATLVGAMLVLFPNMSTNIANTVGVGRGADLVTYLFLMIFFAAIFNIHLRLRSNAELLTRLAREISLQSTQAPNGDS